MNKYFVDAAALKEFSQSCDILCASKLILADKKISNLLKTIAANEDFCKFLKVCLEDFNYKIEFLKSKKPHGIKKDKFVLSLPQDETLVAYVFCLLCEFENKEKDLTEFLIEYYDYNELFADGYKNFSNAIIVPFKNTVTALCSENEQTPTLPTENKSSTIKIEKEQYSKINKLYSELCRNIDKEGELSAQDRTLYKSVAESFLQAYGEGSSYAMPLFTALKFMCENYRFLNNKIKQIEKIMNKTEK